ncbi:hypothetical protein Bca101_049417 [Brassica carinata]
MEAASEGSNFMEKVMHLDVQEIEFQLESKGRNIFQEKEIIKRDPLTGSEKGTNLDKR